MKYTILIVETISIVIFCVGCVTAEPVSTATDVQPTATPIPQQNRHSLQMNMQN